jgi:uncharacterized protein
MFPKLKRYCFYLPALLLLLGCGAGSGENDEEKLLNRLKNASSPYLRQHADNPVDWYEWGPEALEKAKAENKPLIISIGYASCHWCHVMARESFMDTTVARIMNENFISIKIDREERPDIDKIYMNAAQLITGSGGWPLNAFALPDGRPFHAGTYYPRDQWSDLLKQMIDVYHNENEKLTEYAEALTQGIQTQEVIKIPTDTTLQFNRNAYNSVFESWQPLLDYKWGGFAGEPKFPIPVAGSALLQHYFLTNDEKTLEAIHTTLKGMANGGIYDQLGGGFARYTIDERWRVPHFEKMLYDNGQLAGLYAEAFKLTKEPLYADVVTRTLDFVARELTSPEGGFYSSLNAESEGEEGKYYVWTEDEIKELLDEDAFRLISEYFQIKREGNWEAGKNILFVNTPKDSFAQTHGIGNAAWNETLEEAKNKLLNARDRRTRPSTDTKILTSWNALMMIGYLDAYTALGNEKYLNIALKNAEFIEANLFSEDGQLFRNYHNGNAAIPAFLDDYALLAKAYIDMYQATFDARWLGRARALTEQAIAHFREDSSGMFYYTSDQSDQLVARKMELSDAAMPGSNSVMADVLYHLGEYFYEPEFISMSKNMITHMAREIPGGGPYYANWARLLGLLTYQPYEVVIMGEDAIANSRVIQKNYFPLNIYSGGIEENLPLLEYKFVKGKTVIYICRNKTCKFPLEDVNEAVQQLGEIPE